MAELRKRTLRAERLEDRHLLAGGPIDVTNRDAVVQAYQNDFKPFIDVPVQWTGNVDGCVAGTVSPQANQATLNVLNYLRNMSGLQSVMADPDLGARATQAALMMQAQNSLSHSPGTSWACYSETGAQAAGASNLYLGVTGPAAMVGYVEDPGDGNKAVGHRRWLQNPNTDRMGIGSTSNANALYVFTPFVDQPEPEYVSWPPAGYVPKELVFPRWSLSREGADFSQATVTLSVAGQTIDTIVHPVQNGFALNTLVWEPIEAFDLVTAEEYPIDVRVENILVNGVAVSQQYTVTPIHPVESVQTVAAAVNDAVATQIGQTFFFDVFANDDLTNPAWSPATTESIRATLVRPPSHGDILYAIGSNSILFYFPDPGFSGVDTFTYRIADLDAGRVSDLATVTVFVNEEGVIQSTFESLELQFQNEVARFVDRITGSVLTEHNVDDIDVTLSGIAETLRIGDFSTNHPILVDFGGGNDTLELEREGAVQIDFGDGSDTVVLSGDYIWNLLVDQSGLIFRNLEQIDLTTAGSQQVNLDGAMLQAIASDQKQMSILATDEDVVRFHGQWSTAEPQLETGAVRHQLQFGEYAVSLTNDNAWLNPVKRNDVDRNGDVTPGDALVIINRLARQAELIRENAPTDYLQPAQGDWYYDVNGDHTITPSDILDVINELAESARPAPGGEQLTAEWNLESSPTPASMTHTETAAIPTEAIPIDWILTTQASSKRAHQDPPAVHSTRTSEPGKQAAHHAPLQIEFQSAAPTTGDPPQEQKTVPQNAASVSDQLVPTLTASDVDVVLAVQTGK